MPPLFEVMHEAKKKGGGDAASIKPGGAAAPETVAPGKSPEAPSRVFPRITTTPEETGEPGRGGAESSASPLWDADQARHGVRKGGLHLTFAGVLLALAVVVALLCVTAVVAYKSGAEDEKNSLLASRVDPPPLAETGGTEQRGPSVLSEKPPAESNVNKSVEPRVASPTGSMGALPVFGDDPRQRGWNYLVVARLFLKDATAAAQYLTENGIPCVVVPPEGVDSLKLQEDRRGNWLVIVRNGYPSEEYSKPAVEAQRTELMKRIKQLGRRWKEDRKGVSALADCFWDKYGR